MVKLSYLRVLKSIAVATAIDIESPKSIAAATAKDSKAPQAIFFNKKQEQIKGKQLFQERFENNYFWGGREAEGQEPCRPFFGS